MNSTASGDKPGTGTAVVTVIDSTYGLRSMFFMISVYLMDSTYGFKTVIFGNVYLIDLSYGF